MKTGAWYDLKVNRFFECTDMAETSEGYFVKMRIWTWFSIIAWFRNEQDAIEYFEYNCTYFGELL